MAEVGALACGCGSGTASDVAPPASGRCARNRTSNCPAEGCNSGMESGRVGPPRPMPSTATRLSGPTSSNCQSSMAMCKAKTFAPRTAVLQLPLQPHLVRIYQEQVFRLDVQPRPPRRQAGVSEQGWVK